MALQLQQVRPMRGLRWIGDAFRTFGRRPLAFLLLFVMFLVTMLLATLVPLIGGVLLMMSLPLLSLGFMLATHSSLLRGPVHPGQFIEPLQGSRERRRTLLLLCALYAVCSYAIMGFSDWFDGGRFDELQRLMTRGDEAHDELAKLLADPLLSWGMVVRVVLAALLSVPFWHAPALVHWGGQGAGQALFSSTLAVWRCKGAFLVYSLGWVGVVGLFGIAAALLFTLFGARQLAGLVAMPAGLVFTTVFYVSLLFTFNDSFRNAGIPAATESPDA